ncbi:MAG: DUF885 domain-containing protein [Woeseiaceae bacterium]|nr:DUF885 domain-containing protein [Woeseiaceae bacterium]
MNARFPILVVCALLIAACSREPEPDAADKVNEIASEFVDTYYAQFPEEVYEVGYPDAPQDRFGDHSPERLAAWNSNVDAWLAQLDAIDVSKLAGTPAAVTYVFTRERLQAIVDRRVCKMDLWNVSPTWTGWQFSIISTLAVQAVGTAEERDAALARVADIDRFLDTEIANLQQGLDKGYTAPQNNVERVIEQVTSLIDTPVDESPFSAPARNSDDAEFVAAYHEIVADEVVPALIRYRDFLANNYEGRNVIGVSANPNGEACYAASIRYWSSLGMEPMDIHRAGLSEMSRIQSEMLHIARTHFGTDDLKGLFEQLRTNPEYTFGSEQEMLDYVQAAVDRGRAEVGNWFGNVPPVDVVVVPSPAYEKDSGGGFYSAGSADGSRPGTYQVGTYNPQGISKAGQESTAFHESYPGHHLQVTLALLNSDLHPVLRFMFISGSVEGWALYTERLADEMGLYSSELARLGMLSNEAYRAARLVVDPGIHVLGWTRQQAIDYMLENTAEGYDSIASEIDRYAAVPGQATSYLIGSLEIQRLRRHAETMLGDKFDIKEFHDRLLANGGVTLPMLATTVDQYIEDTLKGS